MDELKVVDIAPYDGRDSSVTVQGKNHFSDLRDIINLKKKSEMQMDGNRENPMPSSFEDPSNK